MSGGSMLSSSFHAAPTPIQTHMMVRKEELQASPSTALVFKRARRNMNKTFCGGGGTPASGANNFILDPSINLFSSRMKVARLSI
jgi:hypothetical protein